MFVVRRAISNIVNRNHSVSRNQTVENGYHLRHCQFDKCRSVLACYRTETWKIRSEAKADSFAKKEKKRKKKKEKMITAIERVRSTS